MGRSEDVQVGPWGGHGGSYPYVFRPRGTITNIYIRTGGNGGCIDSIKFGYVDASTGDDCESPKYGGDGGHLSQEMTIEEGEVIVELSGTIGSYKGNTVVTSLSFRTNKKTSVFGSVDGTKFSLPVKISTGNFVGFHGRYGLYLDSIGAIVVPK